MAGGSAAAKAQELREKAARLEDEARQWDTGAEGERRTAAVLSGLAARGYVVLDDLAIPGSKANIDHVVIGPTGVVVVETKAYTGSLNVNDGVLWHGRYPLRKELGAAQFEADKVREVVAATGWSVAVRSLMCIHGADVPSDPTASLAPVELCGPLDLLARIEAAPPLLSPAHVAHLTTLIETALPPQQIAAAARPLGPSPSPASRPVAVPTPLQRHRRSSYRASRGARVARSLDAALRKASLFAVRIVVVVIGGLLMIAIAAAALQAIGEQVTSTTTSSMPATTIAPPPPTP